MCLFIGHHNSFRYRIRGQNDLDEGFSQPHICDDIEEFHPFSTSSSIIVPPNDLEIL